MGGKERSLSTSVLALIPPPMFFYVPVDTFSISCWCGSTTAVPLLTPLKGPSMNKVSQGKVNCIKEELG